MSRRTTKQRRAARRRNRSINSNTRMRSLIEYLRMGMSLMRKIFPWLPIPATMLALAPRGQLPDIDLD